jgi:hypothetical protein
MTAGAESLDALFREAVSLVDAGDTAGLERHLARHPRLVRERLDAPGEWLRAKVDGALEGYFQRPYLLWFVAENPVRNEKAPRNIAEVTRAIIAAGKRHAAGSLQEQLDYTLGLVVTGRVPRESGVQLELIDVLTDAGASPADLNGALAYRAIAAVERLIERGARLTLAAALCTDRAHEVAHLASEAGAGDRQIALAAAAVNGKADALATLLGLGVDLNAYSTAIHPHATALHHAVASGCLDAVRVLVEAGAELSIRDRVYQGTPLEWAEHCQHPEIASYLREKGGR